MPCSTVMDSAAPAFSHTECPYQAWADLPLQVSTKEVAWEPIGGRRIAGVSSFGFSGTNAHIVLEEAPPCGAVAKAPGRRSCVLALSARDDKALAELASQFVDALDGRSDDELADICHTANAGRAHFARRATVIGRTVGELQTGLIALARGEDARGVHTARITRRDPPRIAFLFTGQGAQYTGMSQGLYNESPVFRVQPSIDVRNCSHRILRGRCSRCCFLHLGNPRLSMKPPILSRPCLPSNMLSLSCGALGA